MSATFTKKIVFLLAELAIFKSLQLQHNYCQSGQVVSALICAKTINSEPGRN